MSERVTIWRVYIDRDGNLVTMSMTGKKTEKQIRLDSPNHGIIHLEHQQAFYTERSALEAFIVRERGKAIRAQEVAAEAAEAADKATDRLRTVTA